MNNRVGEGEGMTDYLTEILNGITLTQAEVEQLSSEIDVRTYKQGTILLRQGDVSKECYFVLQGCLRQFAIDEAGEENTYNFSTRRNRQRLIIKVIPRGSLQSIQLNVSKILY